MKTCVLYGPKDLRIEERPVSEPQPGFVRLRMGGVGICGSDLHYYHIGRVGNAVVREPMILGHELSGVVDAIGPGVSGLVPGQKVIINPTDECGTCGYCRSGHQNLCPDLRYYGSAARTPHVQGIVYILTYRIYYIKPQQNVSKCGKTTLNMCQNMCPKNPPFMICLIRGRTWEGGFFCVLSPTSSPRIGSHSSALEPPAFVQAPLMRGAKRRPGAA